MIAQRFDVAPEQRCTARLFMVWEDNQQRCNARCQRRDYQNLCQRQMGHRRQKSANLPDRLGFDRSYVMDFHWRQQLHPTRTIASYRRCPGTRDGEPVRLPEDFYSSRNLDDQMIRYIDEAMRISRSSASCLFRPFIFPSRLRLNSSIIYMCLDAGWDVMRRGVLAADH
jgi:hypothetical protein